MSCFAVIEFDVQIKTTDHKVLICHFTQRAWACFESRVAPYLPMSPSWDTRKSLDSVI